MAHVDHHAVIRLEVSLKSSRDFKPQTALTALESIHVGVMVQQVLLVLRKRLVAFLAKLSFSPHRSRKQTNKKKYMVRLGFFITLQSDIVRFRVTQFY